MPGYFTNIQAAKEALQRALSQIGTSRGRVKTDLRVGLRDLGIAEREGREDYTGETIERGVYHSGIRLQGLDKITKAYDRRERDLHRAVRERLADLARAAGDAQSSYRQSILGIKGQDILYRSQLPNVPVPTKTQLYNVGMQASKRLNIPASWISSPALWNLIARESGGNPNAQNPNSTAYGIFQFLDSTWKGTGYQKTADPYVQFLAGLTYIKRRYGSPQNAWNFWQKHHWY